MASLKISLKVNPGSGHPPPLDLGTQLESLFDTVWRSERTWNLEDRIDRHIRFDLWRDQQAQARGRASNEEYGIGGR